MKLATHTIPNQLSVVILLTGGSVVVAGGGFAAAINLGPGPFVFMLALATILLAGANWDASRRLVTGPVLRLSEAVRDLSVAQDYSVRIRRPSDNELGALVDQLNKLIGRMEAATSTFVGKVIGSRPKSPREHESFTSPTSGLRRRRPRRLRPMKLRANSLRT